MNCWQEYVDYLKDNPEGYWFKRKLYGFGWTPARTQGWIVFGLYLAFVFTLVLLQAPHTNEAEAFENIVLPIIGATILFIAITWKTGEPLKWQWGKKRK